MHFSQSLSNLCPWLRMLSQPISGPSVPSPTRSYDACPQVHRLVSQPQHISVLTGVPDNLGWAAQPHQGSVPCTHPPVSPCPSQSSAATLPILNRVEKIILQEYLSAYAPQCLFSLQQHDIVGSISVAPRSFLAELLFKQLFLIMCQCNWLFLLICSAFHLLLVNCIFCSFPCFSCPYLELVNIFLKSGYALQLHVLLFVLVLSKYSMYSITQAFNSGRPFKV